MKWWLNNAKTKYIDMTNIETLETLTGQNQKPEGKNYERIQIEDTPFWLIGNDNSWNIIFGKWKLNKEPIHPKPDNDNIPLNDSEKQYIAKSWLQDNQWNIILSMILAVTTDSQNQQQIEIEKILNKGIKKQQ